jgi:predicted nucleotidyltransferase
MRPPLQGHDRKTVDSSCLSINTEIPGTSMLRRLPLLEDVESVEDKLGSILKKYAKGVYGDCIPAANKVTDVLDSAGLDYTVYQGFVEVAKQYENGGRRLLDHTWVKYDGKIIDPSKAQFDSYGGIVKYYDETNTSKYAGEYPKMWNPREYAKRRKLDKIDPRLKPEIKEDSADKYPNAKWVREFLRWNLGRRVKQRVLGTYIVGSEAKGTAKEGSDLDIAIVIEPVRGKTALKYTEEFHELLAKQNSKCPLWNGRQTDFQFFYEDDPELKQYKKIEI